MKRHKKLSGFVLGLMLLLGLGLVFTNPTQVNATSHGDKYGRVKKFTFPKNMRGTWYSYIGKGKYSKEKITTHQINGKTAYVQSKWWIKHSKLAVPFKYKFIKAGTTTISGKKYVYVDTWVRNMGFPDYYGLFNKKVSGKTHKLMFVSIDAAGANHGVWYAKSKKIASHFKKSYYTNPLQ